MSLMMKHCLTCPVSQTKRAKPSGVPIVPHEIHSFRPRTAPLSRGKGRVQPEYGQMLQIFILENWGDAFASGMTSLEIMDESYTPIRVPISGVSTLPQVLSAPKVLFNGKNVTIDPADMWMVPVEVCILSHNRGHVT